jgi:hypothetical protein
MGIICPVCEEADLNMAYKYQSDQKRLEIELECSSPTCPDRFFGIMYQTSKEVDREATKLAREQKR